MKPFEINPTTEFHLLRHFKFIPESLHKRLEGQTYFYFNYSKNKFQSAILKPADFEKAIKTIGGKFIDKTEQFTPRYILQLCRKYIELKDILNTSGNWKQYQDGVNRLQFQLEYPSIIGVQNIILKKDLHTDEIKRILRKPRSQLHGEDNILVNTITDLPIKSTKTIEVEVVDTPELNFLWVSAYPQNNLDTDDSIDFWDQVVVVQ